MSMCVDMSVLCFWARQDKTPVGLWTIQKGLRKEVTGQQETESQKESNAGTMRDQLEERRERRRRKNKKAEID